VEVSLVQAHKTSQALWRHLGGATGCTLALYKIKRHSFSLGLGASHLQPASPPDMTLMYSSPASRAPHSLPALPRLQNISRRQVGEAWAEVHGGCALRRLSTDL